MKTKILTAMLLLGGLGALLGGEVEQFEITKGPSLVKFLSIQKEVESNKGSSLNKDTYVILLNGINYITGFMDGCIIVAGQADNMPFLLPKEISPKQICAVARDYLTAHPEKTKLPSSVILTLALRQAFPNPDFKAR